MTKLWRRATGPKQFTMAGYEDLERLKGLKYYLPKRLGKSFPKLTIKVTSAHKPNDFFKVGPLNFVSEALKSILEEFDVNAEYHPVKVVYRAKPYSERAFFCAHLLDHVDCLDWKKSKYKLNESKYADELSKLVIDEKKAAGSPLFQLARRSGGLWLCSDELAERIEEEKGITGVCFDKPGNFRGMAPK